MPKGSIAVSKNAVKEGLGRGFTLTRQSERLFMKFRVVNPAHGTLSRNQGKANECQSNAMLRRVSFLLRCFATRPVFDQPPLSAKFWRARPRPIAGLLPPLPFPFQPTETAPSCRLAQLPCVCMARLIAWLRSKDYHWQHITIAAKRRFLLPVGSRGGARS
jgi:hypothetical protein